MSALTALLAVMVFPGGLFVLLNGLAYEWVSRKLVARAQNRVGPRWFQPFADVVKLLAKEEIVPAGTPAGWFNVLPLVAFAGALTAALMVPLMGFAPITSLPGDLIIAIYLLSLLTLCMGLAGASTQDRFSLVGATRALTQMFSYEAPFLLALLGPALMAGSWQIAEISALNAGRWALLFQPIGFVVALIGLMGKLELPPFDAPEAETEIVAGALTEYSGRGLALFKLARSIELVVGLSLIATLYMGGIAGPLEYILKTLGLLLIVTMVHVLFARLRIDQSMRLWWRYGAMLALVQWFIIIMWKVAA
jgi:NADH-quinone oxidoreductase subunit H